MPNHRISRLLTRTAVGAAALAGALSLGVAPAQADDPTYSFVPIRLSVYDIEDDDYFPWTDRSDEPRMYYGDAVWADVVRVGGRITTIPPTDFTGSSMSVSLWERDAGWHDHNDLGTQQVSSANRLLGQERNLDFRTSGWHYQLVYKVIRK
jgi:hypothetical protein